ncbi:MAG TPA: TetR/AcrR family transcriptional regulator C-terminal domain-containing protein [Candidatus Dormibacteraeota bacterium]|jgi:AcrR family transcriptional regulator|nr:TetR/AcrR family transcriptional regulator C-terminal domain-containing protein [Candidatus Dormibacteraeota bacterium]
MAIWQRVTRHRGSGRGALSYAQIATAGVEIADAEGLDAVSMRKVAARVGAGTMSLYRYLDSRDDLIDLMADEVCAEVVVPTRSGDWRRDLAEIARLSRQAALRHPWMAAYSTSAGGFGPNMLAVGESVLRLLHGHGLEPVRAFDIWATVQSFVQGYALEESSHLESERRTGLAAGELRDRRAPFLSSPTIAASYPLLTSLLLSKAGKEGRDAVFERRLGYLLDGLARLFDPAAGE